jgi:hypothetical protein
VGEAVASMEEAVEWARRSPLRNSEIELRKILDADDFSDSFGAQIEAAAERAREDSARRQ